MSERGPDGRDQKMGDQIEHVLREALRVAPLNAGALTRIRAATAQEWRQASNSGLNSTTSRRMLWGSIAAAVAVLAFLVLGYIAAPADSTHLRMIARHNGERA